MDEAVTLATGSWTNIRVNKTVEGSASLAPNLEDAVDPLHNEDAADGDELCQVQESQESQMDSCAGLHGETDRKVWDPGGKEKLGFIDPSTENNFRLGFLCPKELDFGGTQSKVWDPGGN